VLRCIGQKTKCSDQKGEIKLWRELNISLRNAVRNIFLTKIETDRYLIKYNGGVEDSGKMKQ
jgi:hypothetical protein